MCYIQLRWQIRKEGAWIDLENLYWIGFLGAAAAILFAWLQSRRVLAFSEGSDAMKKIASAIRSGANSYLSHQYATVAKVFVVVFLLLLAMAFGTGGAMLSKFTPFAFLTGGIWSGLAGFVGMKIATSANARTANAAHDNIFILSPSIKKYLSYVRISLVCLSYTYFSQ